MTLKEIEERAIRERDKFLNTFYVEAFAEKEIKKSLIAVVSAALGVVKNTWGETTIKTDSYLLKKVSPLARGKAEEVVKEALKDFDPITPPTDSPSEKGVCEVSEGKLTSTS